MVKNHLSRLASPKIWGIAKKGYKWVAKPSPGPHALNKCLTINVLLKDKLNYAKTTKEVKKILNDKSLLIDKIVRKDYKFPVGLMDVIEFPKLNQSFRIVYGLNGKLIAKPVELNESGIKLLKVIGKKNVKGGKIQLNFHDGKNLLLDKSTQKVGDSVVFDLIKKTIIKDISLEKGATVYLDGGKYTGRTAKIKDIVKFNGLQKPKLVFEVEGLEHITLLDYAFVVGKSKSEVTLEEIK